MSSPSLSYARVAWCYDELAAFWSLGAIARARAASVADVARGERVAFAGVGRGSEAVLAARAGARVTAIDVAEAMLGRLAAQARRSALPVECRETSLFDFRAEAPFDRVVANFVLNVFAGDALENAIDAIASWAAPRGAIVVSDFAPARGSLARRGMANAHYWPVALCARALGLCQLHALHDYRPQFEARGFAVTATREVGLYRVQRFERR